nr:MAG TPA: hypothetical protein [Caudoviricetes sp.]
MRKIGAKSIYFDNAFFSDSQTLNPLCSIYFFSGKTFAGKRRYSLGKTACK